MGTSASDAAPDTTIYRYTYDKNGNITAISDGNDVVQNQYAYDHLGQLIREDNRALGYTYVYTYDNAGNRTSKKTYAFTLDTLGTVIDEVTYHYNDSAWGDLLTEYGSDGEYYDELGDLMYGYREDAIYAYDEIGNPTRIYADPENYGFYTGYILEWDGRQLVGMCAAEGSESELWQCGDPIYFTYNADGIRIRASQMDWETNYTVNGGRILEEQRLYAGSEYYTMLYIYDETGAPIGLKYNTTYYYFEKNLQGDIVGIYNEAGVKIGSYTYDAWGNFTVSVTSGVTSNESEVVWNNPFRYRGYYYDSYTGWYYLQTRYYDPEIGRFINTDGYISTGQGLISYNMFAYCNNNPVSYVDPTGEVAWWVVAIVVVVVAIAMDHALAKHAPEGVAVHDDKGEDGLHDQFLYAKGSGAKVDKNGFTFVDLEAGIYRGTSKTFFGDVSLATFGIVNCAVGAYLSEEPKIEASVLASIYTMSYSNTVSFFDWDINISANLHYGAISAGGGFDLKEKKFKFAPPMIGIAGDFTIDFD